MANEKKIPEGKTETNDAEKVATNAKSVNDMPASNLPAGRVLEQEIEELRTIDEYTAFENAVSDEYHEVPVGQGKD